jgi:hypothetical protein
LNSNDLACRLAALIDASNSRKRGQLIIRLHNETLSVVAMRIGNEDRSPIAIHSCSTASTPALFTEIVSDESN